MKKIAIIGLGYVGLPLALAFDKYYKVIGFDNSTNRISELNFSKDINGEHSKKEINKRKNIVFTTNEENLNGADFFIVTVPTPIYQNKLPNLTYLQNACSIVAKKIKKNSIIIFESTVYPGCTEEFCARILEKISGLILNKDFFVGYSPERINVGDKNHTLSKIKKIVSGSTDKSMKKISLLYKKIIKAGIYEAESIKVAEAAKAIENTQRDINIAFINEVGSIFNKLNISINSVLNAAKTKWNFLDFKPGLVGGHCIGVDPYYLAYCANQIGHVPQVINAGRGINDNMANELSKIFYKKIMERFNKKKLYNILILGLSFKENTNDIRNSKVFDLARLLKKKKLIIDIYDPLIAEKIKNKNFNFIKDNKFKKKYHAIFFAVPHKKIIKTLPKISKFLHKNSFIFDFKNAISAKSFYGKEILKF
jgi:UDP-N-acetyl-D-galactosamine dehydrogenase